jgi:chromosome partitioning protein
MAQPKLVGTAELAELLGVSKQTVSNWRSKEDGFPDPIAELKSGPVWDQAAVVAWAVDRGMTSVELKRVASEPTAIVASLMNMKGGVGKSTLTANLGWYCAFRAQKRVLLVDLDPQFNLTQYVLGVDRYEQLVKENKPTILDVFEQVGVNAVTRVAPKREPSSIIMRLKAWNKGGRLDVVPSRLELAWTLKNPQFKEKPLAKFVAAVARNYDLILIDCPPTESILTEAAYLASEYILVPVRPEFLSTIGLQLLARSIADFRERNESAVLRLAGIVFNSTSPTKSEHARSRKDVSNVARQHDWYVFRNEVGYSDSYPRGSRFGTPIFQTDYARWERKLEFEAVAAEFMDRVGLKRNEPGTFTRHC